VSRDSIDAYDVPDRVASYDVDMDVMHPNRVKMVDVIAEFLPVARDTEFTVLELGIGTGYLTKRLLETFPYARVIGVDGATAMVEMAEGRLGELARRVDFRIGDFRELQRLLRAGEMVDAVVSAYALHHLNAHAKGEVVQKAVEVMTDGGWFLNADLVDTQGTAVEERVQQLRVNGIMRRAAPGDQRFASESETRRFLDELQAEESDQPVTLWEDLEILERAGLEDACVLWLEYREAVTAGRKPGS
jgi:ubiquinone/menaquinone biosynthesis C-methylase UbiE